MKEKRSPLLLSVLALSALLLPGRALQPTQVVLPSQAQAKEIELPPTRNTAEGSGKQNGENKHPSQGRWKEPIRLFQEFFGIPTEHVEAQKLSVIAKLVPSSGEPLEWNLSAAQATSGQDLDQALINVKKYSQSYNMEFMIALVPDPLDSNLAESFDQVLDAVQAGCTKSNYLLDSLWLPWTASAAEEKAYRETPGLLLFRDDKIKRRLAGVFLVGETPKRGIQKGALLAALEMIKGLGNNQEPVRILGPFFSGSADSLALALTPQPLLQGEVPLASRDILQGLTFRIITGSATGPGLEDRLGGPPQFERTVIPDDILQNMALTFLHERLGWDEREVALLAESDTAYGRTALQKRSHFTLTTFPSGVSDLRTAWEKDGKFRSSEDDKDPIKPRPLTLDLKLADPTKPIDIIPEFSQLSLSTHDLEISNLLTAISRDEIRYLGIIATDVRDTLFLAKRIRQYAPDVILFTFSNHLLHAHPQFGSDMTGMLVISNFPLFTEGTSSSRVLGAAGDGKHPFRRQFASDFQEGIFRATLRLLHPKNVPLYMDTRGWIAAVGNGALWPITDLPVTMADLSRSLPGYLPTLPTFISDAHQFEPPSRKSKLQTSLLLLSILVFARMLHRTTPPPDSDKTTGRLLLLGYGLLVLSAEILLLACTIRWWHTWELSRLYLPCAAAGAIYAIRTWTRRSRLSREWTRILTTLGLLVLLVPVIAWSLDRLWMPGGAEYFDLRVRKLSSGLSPLVSLGYFAAAIYTWVLLELKRRKLILRQVIPWPLQQPCENILLDCTNLSAELDKRLRRTVPPFLSSRFWGVFGLGIVPAGIYLALTLQPICETRGYGRIFLFLILLCVTLSAVSFAQFLKLWLLLDSRLLRRLDHSSLINSFKRISKQVGWEPMRSFGWQIPTFKMLTLSIEKLNAAHRALRFRPSGVTRDPTVALRQIFDADRLGEFSEEIEARKSLDRIFSDIYEGLAKHRDHPKVQDFFAVRIVAYLRPAVAHMRNCLMAALISGFFTLLAVRSYAFEPKQFVSVGIWTMLIGAVFVTIWVFVQMDRNPTLSAIGGTDPGKVSFDRNFLLNISTYGLIPLLGLIVSQFPQVGRFVGAWFNPLLRVTGAN